MRVLWGNPGKKKGKKGARASVIEEEEIVPNFEVEEEVVPNIAEEEEVVPNLEEEEGLAETEEEAEGLGEKVIEEEEVLAEIEEEEDDCPVIEDNDDKLGVDDCLVDEEIENISEEVREQNIVQEEELRAGDLVNHFGKIVHDYDDNGDTDADSGDDIWNEENIPDPLSSDDEEEEYERRVERGNAMEEEELIGLGKTYGCAEDFKLAVLRYSLKSGRDIKMYKSSTLRLGAKCVYIPEDSEEKECQWRVYCSYDSEKEQVTDQDLYQETHLHDYLPHKYVEDINNCIVVQREA